MLYQHTLKEKIYCRGIGLHTGRKVSMTVFPADEDCGMIFVRRDLPGNPSVNANLFNVRDTRFATTIGLNGVTVSTVEHLLSAFRGLGIDNAIVELDSFEVPIMDGSARPFVEMIKSAGLERQTKRKKFLLIKKAIAVVGENGAYARFEPSDKFVITYSIDFPHPAIGVQNLSLEFSTEEYEKNIAAARTFGFLKDLEYFQAVGLALGGSLRNAIVLDEKKILNKEGLRCPDEFVKHKILDAIGDLSLIGYPIVGHFIAHKSGHYLNNLLLKELFQRRDCWLLVDTTEACNSPRVYSSQNISAPN
ncbi:MAG: UDP-3-O-acyl-N-acetylglucosamine deacetylase [Syntrophales bacterium]|nr:UDP-3-O-acyl-N-acetylglucosamine deacetylase [Syntrophales bacterium]